METLNLNVNLENLTAEEREALMKLVEKSQKKKSEVWKPSGRYWAVNGSVFQDTWTGSDMDNTRYESGNCFETREEAKEELTRRKMLTKWKRLSIESGEEDNPWDSTNGHWSVCYNHLTKKLNFSAVVHCKYGEVYFPTKDSLLVAIKELGEENVKKYILGVRD